MTAILELRAVSKSYGDGPTLVEALHDVDLVVRSGELVAIMGPSGSGKSTMLTIAGTLEQATSGAVDSVNGEGVMRVIRTACKRGVAGVVVTHDAQLASWADRVVFLRDGRLVDHTAAAQGPEALLVPTREP